jgi:hypothetical protein
MSTLVVEYDDPFKGGEVRLTLVKRQNDYLIGLADAVVVVKDEKGKVRLRPAVNVTAAAAVSGGVWRAPTETIARASGVGPAPGPPTGFSSSRRTPTGMMVKPEISADLAALIVLLSLLLLGLGARIAGVNVSLWKLLFFFVPCAAILLIFRQ